MNSSRHIWGAWADLLHRWGVQDATATLLESLGPLTLLGAQVVYLGQPVLNLVAPNNHLTALANMLEDSAETRAFVTYLKEATPQ